MALESRTQGPIDEDWVRPTKDVPVHATKVVELVDLRSLDHLRNSLMIADLLAGSDGGDPQ